MKKLLAFVLFLLLAACGDDSSVREVVGFDDVMSDWGKAEYSLEDRLVQGKFNLAKDLTPVGIALAVLDDTLGVLEEFEGEVFGNRYEFPRRDYETSYARFTYSCETGSGDTVDFVEYVDLRQYEWPDLDILGALLRYRIEHLVVKEHYPLSLARRHAYKNLLDYFSIEYEDFPYSSGWGDKKFKEDFFNELHLPKVPVEDFEELAQDFAAKFAEDEPAGSVE